MKILDFIRDRAVHIILHLAVVFLTVMVLLGFYGGSGALAVLIAVTYLVALAASLGIDFRGKKVFYDHLMDVYKNLDKKNLIAELIEPPDFLEGVYLYDILKNMNKACIEEINQYKFLQEEYREYIELWVHELKNPIASAKLIEQNNPLPATVSMLEEIEKIESYVEQALYYSRSNAVEKDYLVKEFCLKKLVSGVLKKNAKMFIENNVAVRTENLDVTVLCDAKWLAYILGQVMANAVKYARLAGACVTVRAREEENAVHLTVEDNGIGIPPAEVPRIFDKGFTGSNGRRDEHATGMGLYIVKKLCDRLGLHIWAASVLGERTTICITFPKNSMTEIV
jgi:signal transduction histidine kinase